MPNALISQITLPSGVVYDIKDAYARSAIEALSGAAIWVGTTTTELEDGSTTNPITVGGESYTAVAGNVVAYGELEFVWSDVESKWREFGSTGSLKALAFKDSCSASYTPAGTVSQPSFTGTEETISTTYTPAGTVGMDAYTPAGTVSQPSFSGTAASLSVSGTPTGDVTVSVGSGTANYTPAGSVSVTPTIELNTTSVNSIETVGTLPSATMPTLATAVSNENLTLSWTAGSFDAGSLPTKTDNVSVATTVKTATATGSFTGTGVELTAAFAGDALTSTGSYTPAGTVSQPTFTGTEATLTGDFTGTEATISSTYTPAGTVSQPTFTGTAATITAS